MSQSERAKPEVRDGPAGLGEAAGRAGQEGRAPSVIGVVGAGTMGSGIAQLAARSGARALLHDPIAEALERGGARARAGLGKEAEKGRLSEEQARGPGFLVNRCNRPFGLEALRLLAERLAEVETIDRICRLEGRFPMGPFELMDLVGLDVGLAVSRSFFEQSFGEPRWRPSPITARYVAAGLHGRKSGRGFYDYGGDDSAPGEATAGRHRAQDPAPLEPRRPDHGEGVVVISGMGVLADELRDAAVAAGYEVRTTTAPSGDV